MPVQRGRRRQHLGIGDSFLIAYRSPEGNLCAESCTIEAVIQTKDGRNFRYIFDRTKNLPAHLPGEVPERFAVTDVNVAKRLFLEQQQADEKARATPPQPGST